MIHVIADELPRLLACNGSRLMEQSPVAANSGQSSRDEGIAAHYMAQAVLTGQFSDTSELIDRRAPNGIYMDNTMAEHVDGYLDYIRSLPSSVHRVVEAATSIKTANWEIDGRADFIGYDAQTLTLYIPDFKYGWTIVEPEKNWTLFFHALAFVCEHQLTINRAVMTIHQPRPHHHAGRVREWEINHAQFSALNGEFIRRMNTLTDTLNTGPQCTRCKSLTNCPAARAADMNAIEATGTVFNDQIDDATLSFHLDNLMRAQEQIKNSLKAFEELGMHRVSQGRDVANFHIERTLGNRAWLEHVTPDLMQAITGIDLSKPGLITPAQAIKKGANAELIATMTHRPNGAPKLVRENSQKRAKRLLGNK